MKSSDGRRGSPPPRNRTRSAGPGWNDGSGRRASLVIHAAACGQTVFCRTMSAPALRYLRELFDEAPAGFVLLWTLADRRSHWFPVARLEEIACTTTELA